MSEKQQRLVFAIIDFLNQSIENGTVKADDQEGLEVASAFFLVYLHPLKPEIAHIPYHQSSALARLLVSIHPTRSKQKNSP